MEISPDLKVQSLSPDFEVHSHCHKSFLLPPPDDFYTYSCMYSGVTHTHTHTHRKSRLTQNLYLKIDLCVWNSFWIIFIIHLFLFFGFALNCAIKNTFYFPKYFGVHFRACTFYFYLSRYLDGYFYFYLKLFFTPVLYFYLSKKFGYFSHLCVGVMRTPCFRAWRSPSWRRHSNGVEDMDVFHDNFWFHRT